VTPAPVRNAILAALLATEYERILPRLEHVALKRGETVYRADQDIEAVYFPEEAVIAMVDTTEDRRTIEVGLIGREGIVGINIFLGGVVTPDRAIVQLPGGAFRMKSKDLRREVRFGSPLQRLLLNYTRTFLAVISQSVACSQHHSVEQRYCMARCRASSRGNEAGKAGGGGVNLAQRAVEHLDEHRRAADGLLAVSR
jgi:hypothetical protein